MTKKDSLRAFALLGMMLLPTESQAYETRVETRSCFDKKPTDDTLVFELKYEIPRSWIYDNPPLIFEETDPISGNQFILRLLDGTIQMEQTLPRARGIASGSLIYPSMDPIHDGYHDGTGRSYKANVRIFVSKAFTWIEMRNNDIPINETRNTVFFVGMEPHVFDYLIKEECGAFLYTNEDTLKSDIQGNYSAIFYPRETPLFVEHGLKSRSSLVSTVINYSQD